MHEDIKWLFGLIVMFGVIWFMSGSYNKPASNQPFVGLPDSSGGNTSQQDVVHIGNSSGGTNTSSPRPTTPDEISQSLQNAGLKAQEIQKEIAALDLANHTSPLAGRIMIGPISRGGPDGTGEYVVLQTAQTNTEKVLITGLRLESEASGRSIDIPKAAYLPFQNQVNTEQPVYLGPGEIAYIITGRSPVGMSLRLNKCTGFYNQFQSFNPGIPSRCPYPASEPLPPPANQYNDQCLNYISSLPGCFTVISPPLDISPECQRYVTTELNYTKCVDHHKNDRDFYDGDWRLYLNRGNALWKTSRELIHLLDQNGKIIDAITY